MAPIGLTRCSTVSSPPLAVLRKAARLDPLARDHAGAATRALAALGDARALAVQRIHGDLHRAQLLGTAGALLAIDFEDDLINPPELGVLEREIRRVRRGKALVIPRGEGIRFRFGVLLHAGPAADDDLKAAYRDFLAEISATKGPGTP